MKWIELSVQTDAEGAEAAAALLNEFVHGGAAIQEIVTPDPGEVFDRARAFTVRAFFSENDGNALQQAETALWHLAQVRGMTPRTCEIKEEDWAEAWKKYYTIQHIGKRLVIKPSWLDYAARDSEVIIELDPGMAFGTGLHPTTRMCLEAVEERVRSGMRILDVGTGSGILSIAAAKLGAREILALDTDPIAVDAASRNVAINSVQATVRVQGGSIEAHRDAGTYDLVCANILAEVVAELAPLISGSLRRGGLVIGSGILDFKVDTVAGALNHVGIELIEKKQEDDWVTLIGERR